VRVGAGARLEADGAIVERHVRGGSAIAVLGDGVVALRQVALRDNGADPGPSATPTGAAIAALDDATVAIDDSGLAVNRVSGDGGAVLAAGTSRVTIDDTDFEANRAAGHGGAIAATGQAEVVLRETRFFWNEAGVGGGAVALLGDATLTAGLGLWRSNVAGGAAEGGGALHAAGTAAAALTEVTLLQNRATATVGGGAVLARGDAEVEVLRSTLAGNSVLPSAGAPPPVGGGAIAVADTGRAVVTNSTIDGNVAGGGGGGGLLLRDAGEVQSTNATWSDNTAASGGAILDATGSPAGTVRARFVNSLVAGNQAGAGRGCTTTGGPTALHSDGSNLEDGSTCPFTAPGDQRDAFPALQLLDDRGGPTSTRGLLIISAARNRANAAACPATDQRGIARPQETGCDVGAFEYVPGQLVGGRFVAFGVAASSPSAIRPDSFIPDPTAAASARPCSSRRAIAIRVRLRSSTIRSIRLTLGGRTLESRRRGNRVVADIDLRRRPKGTYKVGITVRLKSGRTRRGSRTYRTCVRTSRSTKKRPPRL
jgi:predicted outer membrane repeat protein